MLGSLEQFGGALAHLLSGWGVLNVFWATLLGIIIGALPGLTATMGVALLTPVLSEVALKFQSFEFFWIALFGIVICGTLAGGDPLKGYLAGFLGLFVATIGQEPYYNYQRFAFGSTDFAGGIGLLPALVGAFGIAEVLQSMRRP